MSISLAQSIKGYELLDLIGEGAFGAVYRAHQPVVDREVAVKIILPEYANRPDFIRRFETEAQLVAQLEHLHIVPLYDYWRDPDGAYLVMRLMKGGNLEDALQDGPMELVAAVKLVDQITSALTAAHQQGVIHRDIKPANILLDDDDNAYLSDFGIAKAIGEQAGLTVTGAILGTPAYISPEQVQSLPLSPQTDIYALGVVLYEMLTGQHPFLDTPTGVLMVKHLQEPLPLIRDSHPELPGEVDEVIQKATSKDPAARYPDVLSLARDFRQALRLVVEVPEEIEGELFNPYKGLRAFQEADSDDFFGRVDLTKELILRLQDEGEFSRFLAVVGPSGSGKSSVVKAGLLPTLRQGAVTGSDQWYFLDMIPKAHPIEELDINLSRISANPNVNIGEQLQRDTRGLLRAARMALPTDEGELLLIIDQFEEVYTQVEDPNEARQFMSLIHQAVTDPHSQVRVIITLRADFYDRPLMFPEFSHLVKKRTAVVVPMTSEELALAIRCPAERAGAVVEEGLVTTIVADVVEQPGALPLLQYALTELFEGREGRLLTNHGYQSIGGVLGALGSRAEEVYADLDEVGKDAARQLFLRLVTLGEGVEDTRRRVLRSEVEALPVEVSHAKSPHVMADVIETFGKARLLSFDHDPVTRGPTVEVAHEALLREWRRLSEWLDESRADVRMQRILARAATDWIAADQDASFIMRGSRLAQFEEWSQGTSIALTSEESSYLKASLKERRRREEEEATRQAHEAALERRSRNFLRGLVGVFAVATVVAVVLSVYALSARNQARSEADARATQQVIAESEADQRATAEAREIEQREEALSQASARATAEYKNLMRQEEEWRQISIDLAIRSLDELKGPNPELAVLLALEILETYPYTPQAELSLNKAVQESSAHRIPRIGSFASTNVYWSPIDDTIATSLNDQYILIQDTETGEEVWRIPTEPKCNSVQDWSPEGDRLPVFGEDCAPAIYDAESGATLVTLESQPDQTFLSASWSPDGTSLVTGSQDRIARIWDASSGVKRLDLIGHSHSIEEVAWAPTGDRIATASRDMFVKIWDSESGEVERTLSDHISTVQGVSWSPDGQKIVSGGNDNAAYVWDAITGIILLRLSGHKDGVIDVAWSPDGRFIATLSWDQTARVWDAVSGTELFRINTSPYLDPNSISWSPIGDQLLIAGQHYHQVWDFNDLSPLMIGHSDTLQDAQWSPDGQLVATASMDATLRLWEAASGEHSKTLNLPDVPDSFTWSPDGNNLVSASSDGTTLIWDISTGETPIEITSKSDLRFYSLSWSSDGSRIAALRSTDGMILIWDAETGKELSFNQSNKDCSLDHLSWSPGGDRLLTTCQEDNSVQVWDASTGELWIGLEDETGSAKVAVWSPDGKAIALGYEDGTIKVWNLPGANSAGTFILPSTGYSIQDLSWSPNSIRLSSAEGGGMVRVWDLPSRGEVANFQVPESANSVDWSPDGKFVIVTNSTGTVPIIQRIWGSTHDLMQYAYQCCAWRELTPEERVRFELPDQ